jgi:hypothetical protein
MHADRKVTLQDMELTLTSLHIGEKLYGTWEKLLRSEYLRCPLFKWRICNGMVGT